VQELIDLQEEIKSFIPASVKITVSNEISRFNNVTDCIKVFSQKLVIPDGTKTRAHTPFSGGVSDLR
jgi:hypothetical protein